MPRIAPAPLAKQPYSCKRNGRWGRAGGPLHSYLQATHNAKPRRPNPAPRWRRPRKAGKPGIRRTCLRTFEPANARRDAARRFRRRHWVGPLPFSLALGRAQSPPLTCVSQSRAGGGGGLSGLIPKEPLGSTSGRVAAIPTGPGQRRADANAMASHGLALDACPLTPPRPLRVHPSSWQEEGSVGGAHPESEDPLE